MAVKQSRPYCQAATSQGLQPLFLFRPLLLVSSGLGFMLSFGEGSFELPSLVFRNSGDCFKLKKEWPLNPNRGALIITYTILGVPYYIHSSMAPNTLLKLLRPLYWTLNPKTPQARPEDLSPWECRILGWRQVEDFQEWGLNPKP